MEAHAQLSRSCSCGCVVPCYDSPLLQVEWLRERIQAVPVRLAFESALELMSTTQIGTFQVTPTHLYCVWSQVA